MAECILNPASQDVADFIYRFGSLQNNLRDPEQFPCVDYVSMIMLFFIQSLKTPFPFLWNVSPTTAFPLFLPCWTTPPWKLPGSFPPFRHLH